MTMKAVAGLGVALASVLAVSGCASTEVAAPPTGRKLSWISYISGEDLRQTCAKGGPERYRLVFNADDSRSVRTYDVTSDPDTGGATLEAQVFAASDLARIDPSEPLASVRGRKADARLTPQQFAAFVVVLGESGAFEPMRDRHFRSGGIYWLVNGCHGGRWFFSAYPYPESRFLDIHRPAEPDRDAAPGSWLSAERP